MWKTELLVELSRAKYIESGASAAIFERGDDSDTSFNGRVWRPGCYATRTLPLFSKREIRFLVKFFLAWGDGGGRVKGPITASETALLGNALRLQSTLKGVQLFFPP